MFFGTGCPFIITNNIIISFARTCITGKLLRRNQCIKELFKAKAVILSRLCKIRDLSPVYTLDKPGKTQQMMIDMYQDLRWTVAFSCNVQQYLGLIQDNKLSQQVMFVLA